MVKKKLKLSGLHCVSCSLVIEGELEDVGVNAKCDYAKQEVEVVYDEAKIDEQQIKDVIEKRGYRVVG